MTVQRVGGVEVATVALTPDGLLALADFLRDSLRADTRTTGTRRAVLLDVVQAVHAAAVPIAEQRRELRTADKASSEGCSRTAPANGSTPAPASATSDHVPGSAWLSVNEAAAKIGTGSRWVQKLAKDGRLTARRSSTGAYEIDPMAVAMWSRPLQF